MGRGGRSPGAASRVVPPTSGVAVDQWGSTRRRAGGPCPDGIVPTAALADPQSWMTLLRREMGQPHEKKGPHLDARWAWGAPGGHAAGALGTTSTPASQPRGLGPESPP